MATAAGEVLVRLRSGPLTGDALKDAGDAASQEHLAAELARRFPDDAVLSEEAADDERACGRARVWIIDPLDGTREFAEPPRDDWAVHVALVVDGVLAAGAVALPGRRLTLDTGSPPPARPSHDGPPTAGRQPDPTDGARSAPGGGRSAPSWSRWDPPAPRPWPWCSATPTCTPTRAASTSGTRPPPSRWRPRPASTCRGSTVRPSRYNQPDPWLPDVLICRPDLADAVIRTCREVDS